MTARVVVCLTVASALLIFPPGGAPSAQSRGEQTASSCRHPPVSTAYARSVDRALRARVDLWGNALLRAPGGPTYERARRFLAPLLLARGPGGRNLTESGFHYVAFSPAVGPDGSGTPALHVADGSQIVSKRAGGRALTIDVGRNGGERYGACVARLSRSRLVAGYLPILRTGFVDAQGVRYDQESFTTRAPEGGGRTFVRLRGDSRTSQAEAVMQLSTSEQAVNRVVVSQEAETTYVAWAPADDVLQTVPRAEYESAREGVIRYWRDRLREGAVIEVPEARVRNAQRSLLVQNLVLAWRYSVGNPYQQFSYPEALDVAQVLSAHGHEAMARSILERSLETPRGPYPSWRIGQKLVAAALHHRLFRDRRLLTTLTPVLRRDVEFLAGQLVSGEHGLLQRERFSSDIPDLVHGLHAQAVVWQGLRAMQRVWGNARATSLARRCRALADRLEAGLRSAVASSSRRLADGSLFVPVRLLDDEQPYRSVTESQAGSYWNLVAPYALASGLFPPQGREASHVLRYLRLHGSRLLGLVRAGAFSLYGRERTPSGSGINPVYGLNVARFLADNDEPDELVLSLYGHLAAGMTPGTHVGGEAVSVAPLEGELYRSTYLPPNGASNASFLETLRLMLVHETRDRGGRPNGLELAFATPRAWLESGRRIEVRELPTSFGPIAFAIQSLQDHVRASVDVPGWSRAPRLALRLRLPAGRRITRVLVNGRPSKDFNARTGTIDLSGLRGRLEISVGVAGT